MQHFILSPDAEGGAATLQTPPVTDTHTRHEANVPRKDAELFSVCTNAASQWKATPAITLLWKTQAAFEAETIAFGNELDQRTTEGGNVPQVTKNMENVDKSIEDAIPFMKTYINGKWGPKDEPSHYAAFGLVHRHEHYEFPTQRQQRISSINMMVSAVHAAGFDANQFGTPFWKDIQQQYEALTASATNASGSISEHVSQLVQMRTNLRRVLHSLLLLIEANYPDTFEQIRRTWGFQKEKY